MLFFAMEILKDKTRLPIYNWAGTIEKKALEQAKNLANLDFAFHHIALMPDCHVGYGMPIGGVLATKDKVIPHAVGVDIGCGVCAVKSNFYGELDIKTLGKIMSFVREKVPVGFKKNKIKDKRIFEMLEQSGLSENSVCFQERKNAAVSLGTLGGGNHFVDFMKDEKNYLWIMIHSGSRNLGKKVCDFYNDLAKKKNGENNDLAFLAIDSKEGQRYLKEMEFCLEFAFENRQKIMKFCLEGIREFLGDVEFEEMINIHHNYAAIENHFGKRVVVHRKGATSAREGEIGIVPGSQGTSSYIVRGKGNKNSFESCSHGAGRRIGRKKAVDILDLEKEKKKLDDLGILHGVRGTRDLDEAVSAYKDIEDVMRKQEDLVEVIVRLFPIGVLKG